MSYDENGEYVRDWEFSQIDWRGMHINIRYERNFLSLGRCHLEIESVPERTPMPISETGFLSHFSDQAAVEAAGGPVVYVRAALDEAAKGRVWKDRQTATRQLALF